MHGPPRPPATTGHGTTCRALFRRSGQDLHVLCCRACWPCLCLLQWPEAWGSFGSGGALLQGVAQLLMSQQQPDAAALLQPLTAAETAPLDTAALDGPPAAPAVAAAGAPGAVGVEGAAQAGVRADAPPPAGDA